MDRNRAIYNGISKRDFIDNFSVSDDIVVRFQDYVNLRERTNISFVAFSSAIKVIIKGTLARQLYDDNAFEEIINKHDIMIDEVLFLSQKEFISNNNQDED